MKSAHELLLYPYLTEKMSYAIDGDRQQVAFKVLSSADKVRVRKAIEQVFSVKVDGVRIVNVKGKKKRLGRFEGKRPDWKKAIVTLSEGYSINFYEGK